jgi:hypothetical protein
VLYDSAEKEGRATCESDWKDGKPSNEELPPPLLNEDDEVVKLVLVCPSGLLLPAARVHDCDSFDDSGCCSRSS